MRSPGLALILFLSSLLLAPGAAGADKIDRHVAQLERGPGYKERLSAAIQLAKSSDRRAIAALGHVLENDRSRTIRRLAALSLGKMIQATTPRGLRADVERVLSRAAEGDEDRKVRRNARQSLQRLSEVPARAPAGDDVRPRRIHDPGPSGKGGVFLHVGTPRDASRRSPRGVAPALHDAVRGALRKHAPDYRLDWPSQEPPTADQLQRSRMRAYRVQAAIMGYRIRTRGSRAEIECTVAVQINPWQGRDTAERWSEQEAAAATGRGRVSGPNRSADIAAAKRDCVVTVAERVTGEQVVPFLRRLEAARP